MNKKDFAKLCFNFNKEPNEDLYELWEYNLRCYDEEELSKAINIIITNDKYFPTLSRVLEVVREIVSKDNTIYDDEHKKDKMLKSGIVPKWLDKEIKNQPIDEETQQEFDNFNKFIEEFRK